MSTRTKVIILTIAVAIPAFILGPVLWPPAASDGNGPGSLLPFFMIVSALESIALGLGISFLVFGRSWAKCVAQESRTAATILYVSIAWSLVSWWPHDNMHISNDHDNWGRLLVIEYLFHVTLLLAAAGMAWSFFKVMKRCQVAVA